MLVGWICVKGLGNNVLADYFWGRAVLLTSPTVVAVGATDRTPTLLGLSVLPALCGLMSIGWICAGLSVTVPLAFLADFILHQAVPDKLNTAVRATRHRPASPIH